MSAWGTAAYEHAGTMSCLSVLGPMVPCCLSFTHRDYLTPTPALVVTLGAFSAACKSTTSSLFQLFSGNIFSTNLQQLSFHHNPLSIHLLVRSSCKVQYLPSFGSNADSTDTLSGRSNQIVNGSACTASSLIITITPPKTALLL